MNYTNKEYHQVGITTPATSTPINSTRTNSKPTSNKPHTDNSIGLELKQILADIEPVTTDVLEKHSQLQELSLYLDDGIDKQTVLYLGTNIPIISGDDKGSMAQQAINSITLVLLDNQGEPATLASYSIDHPTKKPFIHDTAIPSAFVIGDMSLDSEWWCVNGIKLYRALSANEPVTVLVAINPYQFNDVVKHFAEVKQVNINVTSNQKDKAIKQLAGVNALLFSTVIAIADCLEHDKLPSDVIEDDNSEIIDLATMAWGEPESLANDPSKPTPYPIEAWSGLLKQVVEKIAYYAQVPHAMAGQCVLGALAHMGQRFVNAPMGNSFMPTSLILITEGDSGCGKSSAMKLSHAQIQQQERQQYESYILLLDEWQKEKAMLKGSELKEFLATTPMPINQQSLFKDSTIEPILDKYVNGEIINASWSTDEAGQFFNSYTMKGDTAGSAMGAVVQLYDGGGVNRHRSQKGANANPKTQAYDVRFTMFLMGQRVILEPALTNEVLNGQGMLARALIACPNSLQGSRVWNDPQRRQQSPFTDTVLISYWDRCNSLLDPVASKNPDMGLIVDGKPNRMNMQWADRQTEQAFYDCYQVMEDRQATGGKYAGLKSYASRMAENASRIASLFAFFDDRMVITTDDVSNAFQLVEYSMNERLRYLDIGSGEQSDTEKLSEWLIKNAKGKNPPSLNKGYVSTHAPSKLRGKRLTPLLECLESMNHIKIEKQGRAIIIMVNPKLIKS